MLKLKNIKKTYSVVSGDVYALKGINLEFRKNEFVSILGPSGCGKTTLLNLIGGLDKYTSGDLIINGKSTKKFNDRDWDNYRNHSIGFIFQSYNLIPHQSILGNVELALTISGIGKEERIRRAKEALDKVGLKDNYYKKPNQLSGGQCQRVAIARALVNEPEILLADEPTGALDTETSIQIMELIKKIAEERLVIMVTHNPELAQKYSTRTIKLLDGEVLDDSNPYELNEDIVVTESKDKVNAKMSFFTAFKLSLQNLFTKKARTILTAIAGSIGIIGVSAVLSVSNGIQTYVKDMQNDMLSGNPITITETAFDISRMMSGMSTEEKKDIIKEAGYVSVDSMISSLVERSKNMENLLITNNIKQEYIDYLKNMPKEYNTVVDYNYGINVSNNIYTNFYENENSNPQNISLSAINQIYTSILEKTEYAKYSSLITSLTSTYSQSINDEDYLLEQYNMLYGNIATKKDEIMIVLDSNNRLSDLLLAQLGYFTQDQFFNLMYKTDSESTLYKQELDKNKFKYDELIGKEFKWYSNDTIYNSNTNTQNPFTYNAYSNSFTSGEEGLNLKIVGILEPKSNLNYTSLSSGFYYTEDLAEHILKSSEKSKIVNYLKNSDLSGFDSYNFKQQDTDGNVIASFDMGITYLYSYQFDVNSDGIISIDEVFNNQTGYVGSVDQTSSFLGMITGSNKLQKIYSLSKRELGGENIPNTISIYPRNFKDKEKVLDYLEQWNSSESINVNGIIYDSSSRTKITYTDTLSIIIEMINSFIQIITIALIAFTSLSLVVSCVMIGIITYVSVVERIKEIGVIRSLGGRKKDVAHLFNAETFIIGLSSGTIGVIITYILSFGINILVSTLADIPSIAIFPIKYAIIMIIISVILTSISGLLPASSAAKKDPVVALRTE